MLTLPPIALARCGVDDNCDPNAVCVNTDTGFVCECLTGYEGNGVDCSKLCSLKSIWDDNKGTDYVVWIKFM